MRQETLIELKKAVESQHNKPFTIMRLNKSHSIQECKALNFIYELLKEGAPLYTINVNDWANSSIKVYVGVAFKDKVRIYKRFSNTDIESALSWLKTRGYLK